MKNKIRYISALILALAMVMGLVPHSFTAAADLTTKFRVYQNDHILLEFADQPNAIAYAKRYANSHVEEISTRKWLWDNYPRYRVYQLDNTLPRWEFATLEQAIAEAKKWKNASVRDLQAAGWVWHNYPKYTVYQGDVTLANWQFTELTAAIQEAKKWANSHIISLHNNHWVWDNIPAQSKQELRKGDPMYTVYQGTYTRETWKFAYLEDAIQEALKWKNSHIVKGTDDNIIFSNFSQYQVFQEQLLLDSFVDLEAAIRLATQYDHTTIVANNRDIWSSWPFYQVFQNENLIGDHSTIAQALQQSIRFENASIRTYHGKKIWDNFRNLIYWGWNGSYKTEAIKSHVAQTQGLDIDSPTWFTLKDANGNIEDTSDPALAAWLKNQNIAIHPLVHNQFSSSLTSQFLANKAGQQNFIRQLVQRAKQLGVQGLNIDFESLAAKDRDAFTAFVADFTTAAHREGLIVSIDLPRGSIKWNHLTAFDHTKLAQIVDYIMTMTYDQHYSGSPNPGSVAGMQWVEEGVREFLSYGIARDKLLMGVPFYVREWKIDLAGRLISNRAILMKDLSNLIAEKKAISTWDPSFQQYRVEYKENGFTYVFWLEDEQSMKSRIEIAKKYDLAGIAAWRLGYDQAELWQSMIKEK